MYIIEKINKLIEESAYEIYKQKFNFKLKISNNLTQGDLTTNSVFKISSILKKTPYNVATEIADNLKNKKNSFIYKIEVIKPGFINIFIGNKKFDIIKQINKDKEKFFSFSPKKISINIEYVSANPTGELHIGHARGAVYGDVLSNLLKKIGYDITKEYYINDLGMQVKKFGKSLQIRYEQLLGHKIEMISDGYHSKDLIELAREIKKNKEKYISVLNEKEKKEFFIKYGINKQLQNIRKTLNNIGVNHDIWTSEKKLYDDKQIEETIKKLKDKKMLYKKDNALWIKTSLYGDEKDKTIIKRDGEYTYLAPDIAYHINKINRLIKNDKKKLIDILGADHHGYITTLKSALKSLDYEEDILEYRIIQMVRLIKNNKEVKMSKRTGNTITLKDLFELVGKDSIRYFFASYSCHTQMDFNLDLAVKKSLENPVFYVKYAYVRICSLLRKLKEIDENIIEISKNKYEFSNLKNDKEGEIINYILDYKNILYNSAETLRPYKFINYIYKLSSKFHYYYNNIKIINEPNRENMIERVALILSLKSIYEDAFYIIGLDIDERM